MLGGDGGRGCLWSRGEEVSHFGRIPNNAKGNRSGSKGWDHVQEERKAGNKEKTHSLSTQEAKVSAKRRTAANRENAANVLIGLFLGPPSSCCWLDCEGCLLGGGGACSVRVKPCCHGEVLTCNACVMLTTCAGIVSKLM